MAAAPRRRRRRCLPLVVLLAVGAAAALVLAFLPLRMRAWVLGVVVCVVGRASSVSVRKMPLSEPPKRSMAKVATSVALASTGAVFLRHKMFATEVAFGAKDAKMVQGLVFSFVALCGNTAASLLRKQVGRTTTVRPAEQVGVATAIQGCVAVAYCARQGLLFSGTTKVGAAFLAPAIGSSVLNALTKTLETKAYAITDVSLCAPFLAFDPVMQFLLPALLAPLACATAGVGCADAKTSFPPYHPLAVCCVATGAYLLSLKSVFLTRDQFTRLAVYMGDAAEPIDLPPPAIIKPVEVWTGKQLFSLMLRPTAKSSLRLNLECPNKKYNTKRTAPEPLHMCPDDGYVCFQGALHGIHGYALHDRTRKGGDEGSDESRRRRNQPRLS